MTTASTTARSKKAFIIIPLIFILLLSACASSLNGRYVSESGRYEIEFKRDGTCTWYELGMFFEGTYEAEDGGYILMIKGSGIFPNTIFHAKNDNNDLIITGGIVDGERFVKA